MGGENGKYRQDITVANDSGKIIYAKVERETKYTTHASGGLEIKGVGYGAGVHAGKDYNWSKVNPGFNTIMDGSYLRFEVVTSTGDQVFISIKSEDGHMLADALPKTAPCAVVVNREGQLADVIEGDHVWTEERKRYTLPRQARKDKDPGLSKEKVSGTECHANQSLPVTQNLVRLMEDTTWYYRNRSDKQAGTDKKKTSDC